MKADTASASWQAGLDSSPVYDPEHQDWNRGTGDTTKVRVPRSSLPNGDEDDSSSEDEIHSIRERECSPRTINKRLSSDALPSRYSVSEPKKYSGKYVPIPEASLEDKKKLNATEALEPIAHAIIAGNSSKVEECLTGLNHFDSNIQSLLRERFRGEGENDCLADLALKYECSTFFRVIIGNASREIIADTRIGTNQSTILHYAFFVMDCKTCNLLIAKYGPEDDTFFRWINSLRDGEGRTPVEAACCAGNLGIIWDIIQPNVGPDTLVSLIGGSPEMERSLLQFICRPDADCFLNGARDMIQLHENIGRLTSYLSPEQLMQSLRFKANEEKSPLQFLVAENIHDGLLNFYNALSLKKLEGKSIGQLILEKPLEASSLMEMAVRDGKYDAITTLFSCISNPGQKIEALNTVLGYYQEFKEDPAKSSYHELFDNLNSYHKVLDFLLDQLPPTDILTPPPRSGKQETESPLQVLLDCGDYSRAYGIATRLHDPVQQLQALKLKPRPVAKSGYRKLVSCVLGGTYSLMASTASYFTGNHLTDDKITGGNVDSLLIWVLREKGEVPLKRLLNQVDPAQAFSTVTEGFQEGKSLFHIVLDGEHFDLAYDFFNRLSKNSRHQLLASQIMGVYGERLLTQVVRKDRINEFRELYQIYPEQVSSIMMKEFQEGKSLFHIALNNGSYQVAYSLAVQVLRQAHIRQVINIKGVNGDTLLTWAWQQWAWQQNGVEEFEFLLGQLKKPEEVFNAITGAGGSGKSLLQIALENDNVQKAYYLYEKIDDQKLQRQAIEKSNQWGGGLPFLLYQEEQYSGKFNSLLDKHGKELVLKFIETNVYSLLKSHCEEKSDQQAVEQLKKISAKFKAIDCTDLLTKRIQGTNALFRIACENDCKDTVFQMCEMLESDDIVQGLLPLLEDQLKLNVRRMMSFEIVSQVISSLDQTGKHSVAQWLIKPLSSGKTPIELALEQCLEYDDKIKENRRIFTDNLRTNIRILLTGFFGLFNIDQIKIVTSTSNHFLHLLLGCKKDCPFSKYALNARTLGIVLEAFAALNISEKGEEPDSLQLEQAMPWQQTDLPSRRKMYIEKFLLGIDGETLLHVSYEKFYTRDIRNDFKDMVEVLKKNNMLYKLLNVTSKKTGMNPVHRLFEIKTKTIFSSDSRSFDSKLTRSMQNDIARQFFDPLTKDSKNLLKECLATRDKEGQTPLHKLYSQSIINTTLVNWLKLELVDDWQELLSIKDNQGKAAEKLQGDN